MLTYTRSLYKTRDLLWEWTSRNVRARYQQSALGWLWAVIQPVVQVLIFTVVFTQFLPVDTGSIPYVLFAYVALLPWGLVASALPDMTNALVDNMSLVTKIYFPREILPIAALLARLMDFGVGAVLVVVLMLFYRTPLYLPGLLFLPLILAVQLLLLVGLGLAGAAANVFLRDVRSILVLGLQVWFYASPIVYPLTVVPEKLSGLYFLNPMAGILAAYRDVLLYNRLPGPYLAVAAGISLVIFILGYWYFKRVEFQFADIV